jgi:hypothetical protein
MRPIVASQLQTWWLHMTEFLVVIMAMGYGMHALKYVIVLSSG